MRVALTTYALHVGGMETCILSLAEGFVRAGHEVHIVTTDERGAWFARSDEVGAQAHFIDGGVRKSRASRARTIGRFLAKGGFDAVINSASWFVQASLGMLPAETATVSVIHNSSEAVVSLACLNARACQALVAPSPATVDLARSRVSREKVHLIQYGVDILESPPPARAESELRVVFCGRIDHSQKGVLLLPEIVRQVSGSGVSIRLEVIGGGPDIEKLTRLIEEAGVSHQVELVGPLSHARSLDKIRAADALILPSFFEGLPFVPLEAMANGAIPVISLLPGITDWMVEDRASGFLLAPGDVQGFSDALVVLGRDPELRQRMSRAAWERAREHFSVARMVNSYLLLVEELRSQPRRKTDVPALAPDMVQWKDRIPFPLRHAGGRLLRMVRAGRGAP
jgi:glycosyltransferase involved in cell wall biosynthesis